MIHAFKMILRQKCAENQVDTIRGNKLMPVLLIDEASNLQDMHAVLEFFTTGIHFEKEYIVSG